MSVEVELSRDPARRPGPHQACLPEEGGSPAPVASLCHGGWRLCHHHPGGSPWLLCLGSRLGSPGRRGSDSVGIRMSHRHVAMMWSEREARPGPDGPAAPPVPPAACAQVSAGWLGSASSREHACLPTAGTGRLGPQRVEPGLLPGSVKPVPHSSCLPALPSLSRLLRSCFAIASDREGSWWETFPGE